jgi:TonB-linked SusC/RagA family outer membrane protein
MKKKWVTSFPKRKSYKKMWLIMRLTMLFFLGCFLFANANSYSQTTRLDVSLKKATINDVIEYIEKNSEFIFLYQKNDLDVTKEVEVDLKNATIHQILDKILQDEAVRYDVYERQIVIRKASTLLKEAAQDEKKITGVVKDQAGTAIPGASVFVQGTTIGTVTDFDGNFSLTVPASTKTISVSFVGMKQAEASIEGVNNVVIVMEESSIGIEEVVAVGYGSQSRKKVSAAITSVSAEDIKGMAATGIDKAIQGKAAGVLVTNNTGEPGGGVTIRVRGTTSIGSGNDPLYVIDGIPLENTQTGNRNVGENRINGMSQINPADIESIEILKDAAAASIYGARAANGVVLITTKRGVKGKGEVSIDVYSGLSEITSRYDLLGASDYARLVNEGRAQLAEAQPEYSPFFSQDFIDNPTVDTDWQDEIFRVGAVNEVNLSLRGGTDATKYMVSSGYYNQQGVIIGSDFSRFNMRANIDQDLGKHITLGTSLYAAYTDQSRTKNDGSPDKSDASNYNHIYGPSVLSTALIKAPTTPVYLEDGTFSNDEFQKEYGNPVRQALAVDITTNVTRIIASAYAQIGLLPELKYRVQASGDIRGELENWFDPPNPNAFEGSDWRGQKSQRTFNQKAWTLENYFTYAKGVKDHSFTLLAGNTIQETTWEDSFILVSGIVSDKVSTLNAGTDIDVATSDKQAYGITSFFGRFNYDYKGKYLLLLNARYDGSSRFGKDNRYGFFPSGSVGWRVSEESFLESAGFLSDWKIRASYGVTGNQEIANYAARGIMSVGVGTNTGSNYNGQTGGVIQSLPSPDLRWEETTQFNLGTDISLFNNRLNMTMDYYVKTTDNLLFQVPLPNTRGISTKLENIGKMENRGFELSLNGTIITNDNFNWNADFNISTNANKVLELLDGKDVIVSGAGGRSIAREGEPISFYLYEREEFVNPENGTVVIVDQDNSGGLPNEGDLVLADSPFPDFFGGLTNNLSYKNFDLSIFFQYSYGNKIYNATRRWLETLSLNDRTIIGGNTTRTAYENRWQQPGDVTKYPVVNYDDRNNNYTLPHTGWLEDGSYLRLKSLTLGYTFDSGLLSRLKLKSARIYLTGNNLLTFTKYSGFDPEVDHFTGMSGGSNSGLLRGYDYGSYPQSKSYRLGINLTF